MHHLYPELRSISNGSTRTTAIPIFLLSFSFVSAIVLHYKQTTQIHQFLRSSDPYLVIFYISMMNDYIRIIIVFFLRSPRGGGARRREAEEDGGFLIFCRLTDHRFTVAPPQ